MTDYLWSKDGNTGPDAAMQDFLSAQDVILDRHLFLHDITASIAHVNGLLRINIVSPEECEQLVAALHDLAAAFSKGEFVLGPPFEDCHSAIEATLIEKLGAVGGKVHTGRSRNDQVQVILRLYMREQLETLAATAKALAEAFLTRAQEMADWAMPGYTHLQRAVPSSVGLWLGGFAESFLDITNLAVMTRDWLNTSPLGTAAGFGVNLPLDRAGVASELGFDRIQINPLYTQNSRGTV